MTKTFFKAAVFSLGMTAALVSGWSAKAPTAIFASQTAQAEVSAEQAATFVQGVSERMIGLITSKATRAQKQDQLMALLQQNASLDQIAKFVIGTDWRNMTAEQQARYKNAFKVYVARTYVSRFDEYSGETIDVAGVIDAGRKGQLVQTKVNRIDGGEAINVEWLVSDRSGALKIEDLRVEGVSLAITQRDEFAAMLSARRNDYNVFIDDLMQKSPVPLKK